MWMLDKKYILIVNVWNPQPIQAMANLIPIGSQTILTNLLHASFEASAPNEVSDFSSPQVT